jgi:phosphoglycerate dehydrogenase-like enzyme
MKVLVYHRFASEFNRLIRERFPDLEVAAGHDEGFLAQHIVDADVMLVYGFPLERLKQAARLRWIQLTSAGAEHLFEGRQSLQGIVITNTRGMHADLIADYTFGAIVTLQWNFLDLFLDKQARRWGSRAIEPLMGKTLGIVGLGAIGSEIARRAPSFGMNVIGLKRNPVPIQGVSRVFGPGRLKDVLSESDFVVVAAALTPETYRMIGEQELRAMKKTGFLINIARGRIIDESTLIKALQEKWIAGAFLDAFENEPLPPESPLWELPNVMVTPRISGILKDYAGGVMEIFGENLRRWKEGLPLRNQVDWEKGY